MPGERQFYAHPVEPSYVLNAACTECGWWTHREQSATDVHERAKNHIRETNHSVNELVAYERRLNGH